MPQHRAIGAVAGLGYLIVLVALGLRFHVMGDGEVETDFFGSYVVQAREFLGGQVVIDPFRGPVYPIVLALLGTILGPFGAGLFETGIVLSALSAGAVVFLAHGLLRRLFGPGVAFVGLLVLIANPLFLQYSYTTGTDMFFAALATGAVFALLARPGFSWTALVTSTVLAALAYLTRYSGAVVFLALLVSVVFVDIWRMGWKKRLASVAVGVLLFAVVIAPWGLHCVQEKGRFFYNENYLNVAYSLFPEGTATEHVRHQRPDVFTSFWDVLSFSPPTFLKQIPVRAFQYAARALGEVMRWPVGVVVLAGLVLLYFPRPSRRQAAYLLFGLLYFVVLLAVFYNNRFTLFLIPTLAALASLAVVRVWHVSRRRTAWRRLLVVVALVVLGYSAWSSFAWNRATIPGGRIEFRQMGEARLEESFPGSGTGGKVAARKPHFAYFAGLDPIQLPVVNSHEELLSFLYENDVDYVLFSYVAATTRPALAHLANPRLRHAGLTPLMGTKVAVLYRVDGRGGGEGADTQQ